MGGLAVLRIIRIKTPTPHGRPHKVTTQTQNQFEHTSIKTMITIIRAISVLHPSGQARSLVIQKDTPILYRRFSRRITSTRHRKILPGHHRHIRPVVPRRNTNLFRKLINPINRSAFVTSRNDERLIHSVQGSRYHGHQVFLILALQQRSIYLFRLYQFPDITAFQRTYHNHALYTGSIA